MAWRGIKCYLLVYMYTTVFMAQTLRGLGNNFQCGSASTLPVHAKQKQGNHKASITPMAGSNGFYCRYTAPKRCNDVL